MENEDKNISIEAIAERWVKIVLAHIEAKKQSSNHISNESKNNNEYER